MASSTYFNGVLTNVPGARSKIDASELADIAPGALGVVGLIGTAEGGKPLTVDPEFSDATRDGQILARYRGGDLRHAGVFAFSPSTDPAVPGGAQRVVGVKVNPATQSTLTVLDDDDAEVATLTTRDYGLFTERTSLEIADGTNEGKLYTLSMENTLEEFDDVGEDPIMDLLYTPGSNGYTTHTALITSTLFRANATKAASGVATSFTQPAAASVMTVVSANAGDTTQTVTIYGLDGSNVPISETLSLNGTTPVTGSTSFTQVTGASKSAATLGNVTISDDDPVTIATIPLASTALGVQVMTNAPAQGVLTVSIDTDAAGADVVVRGTNAAGTAIAERFSMATAASSPVTGSLTFASITQIELGDVANARTVTVALTTFQTTHALYPTIKQVVDRLNLLSGFTANSLRNNTFRFADADRRAAASIMGAALEFYADVFDFVSKVNAESQLVTAARLSTGALPPANTSVPLPFTGGGEGTTTITEWQQAIDLLKKRRVNLIVPLTNDPAVHALLATHLVLRAGELRSESQGVIGIGVETDDDEYEALYGQARIGGETRANIKSQIQLLNTRHISAISQEILRFDPDTGLPRWYPPHYAAVIAAGMKAGSVVGEPLTTKRLFVNDVRNHSSWSVEDDKIEMIDAGLMMIEKVDGEGIRWVRSITTHLDDDNVVFCEMSACEALNTALFELRRRVQLKVGQRGIRGTVAVMKAIAQEELERLVNEEILAAFKGLKVSQIGDTFPIEVSMAPVLPINFINVTCHIYAVRAAA